MNGAMRRRAWLFGAGRRAGQRAGRGGRQTALVGLVAFASLFGGQTSFADGVSNHVKDVRVHAEGASTTVEVTGTTAPVYNMRIDGDRLVLELANADIDGAPAAITPSAGLVGGVLSQSFKGDGGTSARVTVNLLKHATFRIVKDGPILRLVLTPGDKTQADPTLVTAGSSPGTPGSTEPQAVVVPSEMQKVRFERVPPLSPSGSGSGSASTSTTGDGKAPDKSGKHDPSSCSAGCDRIVIEFSSIPSYTVESTMSGHLRLELKDTKLSDMAARTLDVSSYRGFVHTVAAFHETKETGTATGKDKDKDKANVTVVEISREGDSDGDIVVDDNKLMWVFDVPRGTRWSTSGKYVSKFDVGRAAVTVAKDPDFADVPKVETSIHGSDGTEVATAGGGEAGFQQTVNAQSVGTLGRYNGRRIDLDLKDADIHNILRLLADVGHVNVVTADDVTGNVTIRMRNVPWDEALDVVLQAKGLGMVRAGNLIRVAPMAQLNKERELRLAQMKQELELSPLETRLIPVSYANADELKDRTKELLSPRGSIAVDERTNTLITRDVPGNIAHVEELVRALDLQTPQVLIEARIVEATSAYARDIGIQWGGDVTFSPATGNPTGLGFPSAVGVTGGNYDNNTPTAGLTPFERTVPNPNFAVNLPAATATDQGGALGISLGSIDNAINLNLRLSALESSALVRIVSNPRVLTLDNTEARINEGTLIPYSQVSAQGAQTTFQEAKLQLLVKPHVTADGSVSMHVKLNRDEPDFSQTAANGAPTILKREAETNLLVMDGHTAVIGGIYTRNTGRNLSQVPFFGDIPILGVLFQRRQASDARGELVIFLTPRIVNRAEALGR
jgi:type IV pilus assembly protein PilQ